MTAAAATATMPQSIFFMLVCGRVWLWLRLYDVYACRSVDGEKEAHIPSLLQVRFVSVDLFWNQFFSQKYSNQKIDKRINQCIKLYVIGKMMWEKKRSLVLLQSYDLLAINNNSNNNRNNNNNTKNEREKTHYIRT